MLSLQSQREKGSLAEWLGTGLQNRLRRFESARNLQNKKASKIDAFLFFRNYR